MAAAAAVRVYGVAAAAAAAEMVVLSGLALINSMN